MTIIEEKKGDDTDQSFSAESREVKNPLMSSSSTDVSNSYNTTQIDNNDVTTSIVSVPIPTSFDVIRFVRILYSQ